MKIALLTWFDYNYGTALQVLSTNTFLKQNKNELLVINYRSQHKKFHFWRDRKMFFTKVKLKLKRKIYDSYILIYCKDLFDEFYAEKLDFTDPCQNESDLYKLNEYFDIFVCGSDQIWSPLNYDKHFFLDFVNDDKTKIAYAPSFGINKIKGFPFYKEMINLISRFSYLSLRERTYIKELKSFGKDIHHVCDPTLFFSANEWNEILNIKNDSEDDPYLLMYFLGECQKNLDASKKMAEKLNLKIKTIPVFTGKVKYTNSQNDIGPVEFVKMIKNAEYVCTDSFHGVIFSIIYNRQFCCFKRFKGYELLNQNSRIIDFLNFVNLDNRIYNKKNKQHLFEQIDYKNVMKIIERFRKESVEYLLNSLKDKKNEAVDDE